MIFAELQPAPTAVDPSFGYLLMYRIIPDGMELVRAPQGARDFSGPLPSDVRGSLLIPRSF
jgi:hypothetical protein